MFLCLEPERRKHMNKKTPLLLLAVLAITGCAKTKLLYDENAYNYPQFDKNYYLEWEGIKDLSLEDERFGAYTSLESISDTGAVIKDGYTWGSLEEEKYEKQFGYNNNLSKIEKKFSYGITSKLFDGRVRCEGLYQKSRVQLDKSGFAMYFPKQLVSTSYLGFAVRGGTDYNKGLNLDDFKFNFNWSFYIHLDDGKYQKVSYNLPNVAIPTDNGGNTAYVNFKPYMDTTFSEISGAVAMSFEWECVDERFYAKTDLTDDYTDKEKHHLAVMLYEVFIGDSTWTK